MALNIDSYGMSRTYNNGHLVNGIDYDANYNGSNLNLAMKNQNGKTLFMKMNNREIMDLFNQPTQKHSLHNRIENDFKPIKFHSRSLNNSSRRYRRRSPSRRSTKKHSRSYTRRSNTKKRSPTPGRRKTRKQSKTKKQVTFNNLNDRYINSIDKTIY